MRNILFVAAAALVGLATASVNLAQPAEKVNSTHFKDPKTGKTYVHFNCDVDQGKATDHFNETVHGLHTRGELGAISARDARYVTFRGNTITVNTYVHVITKQASKGSISQTMVNNQIAAMNKMYNPNNINFVLAGTDFTANDAWAVAAGSDMTALKQALRKGKYSDLNLYFHTDLTGGILGTCTLPTTGKFLCASVSNTPADSRQCLQTGAAPSVYYTDGCNCASGTMPGGNIYGYAMGMTAAHETGHWLGLLHTFEGYSCTGNGDSVSDTRQEATSTDGCPTSPAKNSCPNLSGVDPITNVMDYSTDACYTGFTQGQIARINSMWTTYRSGK